MKKISIKTFIVLMLFLFTGMATKAEIIFTDPKAKKEFEDLIALQKKIEEEICSARDFDKQATTYHDGESLLMVALMYEQGKCTIQDYQKSLAVYQKAIDLGYTPAMVNTGIYYLKGRPTIPKDKRKAIDWLMKASDKGNSWGSFWLGWIYADIRSEDYNDKKAYKWLKTAYQQGYKRAMLDLAFQYEFGLPLPENHNQSALWYARALEMDNHNQETTQFLSNLITNDKVTDPIVLAEIKRILKI